MVTDNIIGEPYYPHLIEPRYHSERQLNMTRGKAETQEKERRRPAWALSILADGKDRCVP